MKIELSKEEMQQVKGGYNEERCKQLQELANEEVSEEWDDEIWDTWADIFERNCV